MGARVLLVPTQKTAVNGVDTGLPFPDELNHSWCYEVTGERVGETVSLEDQFRTDESVRVERPRLFCNPVTKTVDSTVTGIEEPDVHLTCYEIKAPQRTDAIQVGIFNQFETDTFTITASELLCVPSAKGEVTSVN